MAIADEDIASGIDGDASGKGEAGGNRSDVWVVRNASTDRVNLKQAATWLKLLATMTSPCVPTATATGNPKEPVLAITLDVGDGPAATTISVMLVLASEAKRLPFSVDRKAKR